MSKYVPGTANAICDRCGFKHKLNELHREWTGLRVCAPCLDKRNPQDFVRGVVDRQSVPNPRPEPADVFLNPGDVTPGSL